MSRPAQDTRSRHRRPAGLPLRSMALAAALCLMGAAASAEVEVVRGTAYGRDGRLAYRERHTITYEAGRVSSIETVFSDAHGAPIGRLSSQFTPDTALCSYDFHDDRNGYHEGARVHPDRIAVYKRPRPHADLQLKYLPRTADQVIGQAFNQFVATRLPQIAAGRDYHVKLVVPSRLKQFAVVIRRHRQRDHRIDIRVTVDSWFLRLFVPHIEVDFDLRTGRLMTYRGISMIADESDKNSTVHVTYAYEPRRPIAASPAGGN